MGGTRATKAGLLQHKVPQRVQCAKWLLSKVPFLPGEQYPACH